MESFLLSMAIFSDIWTIRGLLTSLTLGLRLKAGSLMLWEDGSEAGGHLLGVRKPCIPGSWPSGWKQQSRRSHSPGILLASHWSADVKKSKIPGLPWLTFHFFDYSGISQTTSVSVSFCFPFPSLKLWIMSAIQQHLQSSLKHFESCFNGTAFSNSSGLLSDKNNWYLRSDLHAFSHTELRSCPVKLTG